MDKIRNSKIIKFLLDKNLTAKIIKLSLVLVFIFTTFFNQNFGYVAFALCMIYVLFEFSADSVIWLMIIGINVPYIKMICLQILIWEFIIILLVKLVLDLIKRKINYKNWRFITLISLFTALCLLLLLPLAETYVLSSQLKHLGMFLALLLTVFYVKQINVKNTLLLCVLSIGLICVLFVIAKALEYGNNVVITHAYSKGNVNRFSLFNFDPNFTGLALICAIVSLYILFRKNFINKYFYFISFTILIIFSLMTISKATCIIIALFGIYLLVENVVITIKTKNYKHLLELVYYLVAILIAFSICWKYVDAIYHRFFSVLENEAVSNGETMSNLTTGRSDLWIDYVAKIFSSWQIALFGVGVAGDYAVVGTAAHCMPIEYVYRYGILNTLTMLVIFVIAVIPFIKKAKIYNFVPSIIITIMLCSLGGISARYVYLFVVQYITICCNGAEYELLNEKNCCASNNKLNDNSQLTNS